LDAIITRACNKSHGRTPERGSAAEASAWLAHVSGNDEEAVRLARSAADLEDALEKPAVSPAPVVPAREALGDLLAEMGQPKAALAEYEIALRDTPNRFNGLFGAARAAEQAGERQKAATLYAKLIEVCRPNCRELPQLKDAMVLEK